MPTLPITAIRIPRNSLEHLAVRVTAAHVLDGPVHLALTRGTDEHRWLSAVWTGAPGATRLARTREPVAFGIEVVPEACYDVFVRLGDDLDGAILYAGVIHVD